MRSLKKSYLRQCAVDKNQLKDVIALGVFGSYHEKCFNKDCSDIDIMILLRKEVEWEREMEIEEYLETLIPDFFNHSNIHYTFISDFNYPFSELLLISEDRIVLREEEYLDYVLGYSTFKRDRENLEIMREQNLKELEELRHGVL